MVVLDENRLFGNKTKYVDNMAALVKRDRNHPSVVLWSFCNENDCEGDNEVAGPSFQAAVNQFDGTRPTLANMFTFNDLLSKTVDVQGFSHRSREHLDQCHKEMPEKPILMSECCSCNTMRDEDAGCETMHDNPVSKKSNVSFYIMITILTKFHFENHSFLSIMSVTRKHSMLDVWNNP